jgi:cytochrome c-type biogenesis protein CcmH/NrfF
LLTYLRPEANQQTSTRELSTDVRPEPNQQTGTRELSKDLRSEANQQTDTRQSVCWLASDLRYVVNSLVD